NLVAVDRATLGIAGVLSDSADVDFFRFEVDFEDTVVSPTSFETVFDLDYADGLARANMIISVFDDTGSLILTSREANVAEDRPGNVGTSDIDDLSRGSVGASDPYIGGVELSPGDYYVAVTSDAQMPRELEQFFLVNPLNPDLRLEPINSLQRIAEDHIGFPSPQIDDGLPSTFDPPQVPILINANSEVAFNLGDVVLFVSEDFGVNRTNVLTVDPFTGQRETTVGDFSFDTRDIAFHPNGDLFTFSQGLDEPVPCAPFDANSGNFLRINTGTGAATLINDDGILTYQRDPMDPAASIQTNPCPTTRIGDGIQINELGFCPIGQGEIFGVGDRGFQNRSQAPGVEIFDNILYQFIGDPQSPNFGLGLSSPQPNRVDDPQIPEVRYEGAGTQIRERGELLTSPRIEAVDATVPTRPSDNGFNIKDGTTLTVEDGAQSVEFEFDFGFEAVQLVDGNNALTIRDGNFFQLDDDIFQLDTGPVIAVNPSGVDLRDGTVVSLNRAGVNVGNFEFTLDVMNIGGGNTPVLYALQDNSLTLANKLVATINLANTGATPIGVTASVSPRGDRISLVDSTGGSSAVAAQVSTGSAKRRNPGNGVSTLGIRVEGDLLEAPILQALDGSKIRDGDTFRLDTASTGGSPVTFEFESGFTLNIPDTFQIQVPGRGGRDIVDGETFLIEFDDGMGTITSVTFEFDSNNSFGALNTQIPFTLGNTQDQIADAIVTELVNANLNLFPSNQGSGDVHLGSMGANNVDISGAPNLTLTGVAQGVADGETFSISNGTFTRVFEFDSDPFPGNAVGVRIPFSPADTADQIAQLVATTVAGVGLGLSPSAIGNGDVHIGGQSNPGGSPNHTLITPGPALTQTGSPGVSQMPLHSAVDFIPASSFTGVQVATNIVASIQTASAAALTIPVPAGSLLVDGQIEVVNDNGTLLTFEYDDETSLNAPPGTVSIAPPPGVLG
ncbi:MAG: hypothetical protein QGG09_13030, partial [Pirellulaceae bacterium]|nr:hypothetical protein [Pirellulaceae bacterium]